MWGPLPWPGIEPGLPALGARSLSHWHQGSPCRSCHCVTTTLWLGVVGWVGFTPRPNYKHILIPWNWTSYLENGLCIFKWSLHIIKFSILGYESTWIIQFSSVAQSLHLCRWALSPMWSVILRAKQRESWQIEQKRRPGNQWRRNSRAADTSSGMPRATRSWKRQGVGSPLEALEEA